jgi:hypothetical protein
MWVVSLTVLVVAAGWAGVGAAAPKPLPIGARVIHQGDFVGYSPEPKPTSYKTIAAWVASDSSLTAQQSAADKARLSREGFKAALTEFLDRGSDKRDGVSWVAQLGSASAARAELAATLQEDKEGAALYGHQFSLIKVAAIPGALGWRETGGGFVGENVLFADGPFLYLLGQGWSAGDKHPPTLAGLIAAVKKLYTRVHGHPAG